MDQNTPKPSDTLMSISKIQEQLNALNRKMDMILGKLVHNGSSPKPVPQTPSKNLFQVICADCKKECSIPFKPTADRPVYCKECFARRRSGQNVKVHAPELVKTSAPVQPAVGGLKETKKPAVKKAVAKKKAVKKTAVKKTVVKKKTATRKKK